MLKQHTLLIRHNVNLFNHSKHAFTINGVSDKDDNNAKLRECPIVVTIITRKYVWSVHTNNSHPHIRCITLFYRCVRTCLEASLIPQQHSSPHWGHWISRYELTEMHNNAAKILNKEISTIQTIDSHLSPGIFSEKNSRIRIQVS